MAERESGGGHDELRFSFALLTFKKNMMILLRKVRQLANFCFALLACLPPTCLDCYKSKSRPIPMRCDAMRCDVQDSNASQHAQN